MDEIVVTGIVVVGDSRGRELGFPTANVEINPSGPLTAEDGVYAGWLEDAAGDRRTAAVSIGSRPTYYGEQGARLVEVYVLDFEGDLYGQLVKVGVGERVRGQMRFSSSDELIAQMNEDVEAVRLVAARRS